MGDFNKDEFAELLNRAKGEMSINEYAYKCGVSAAHISRLLRRMLDAPPSPAIISKFIDHAHNGITYEHMMKATGYLDMQDINPQKIAKQDMLNINKQDILNITKNYLLDNNHSWSDKELLIKEITELYWKLKFS